jgi:hypothetical protein
MNDKPVPGQEKLTFRIKRCAISIDLSQKTYGTGPDSYCSLSADVDSATLERLPDVVDGALDLYIHVWKVLVAGQLAAKLTSQSSADFVEMLHSVEKRLTRIRALLREMPSLPNPLIDDHAN